MIPTKVSVTYLQLVIELHANFLEINLLSQIRALPNPSFNTSKSPEHAHPHPLTLHLSPTSTATIIVNSFSPSLSSSVPFAKIAPDAEVIVAPKTRPKLAHNDRTTSRSITSNSRRSVGGKSISGTTNRRSQRKEPATKDVLFLRAVDRRFCYDWFDDDESSQDVGLRVWLDPDVLLTKALRGIEWVQISIVRPAGILPPIDPVQQQNLRDAEASGVGKPASKVVAKVVAWDGAPDVRHISLSSPLSSALGFDGIVGGLVRIQAAPPRLLSGMVKSMKLFPFKNSELRGSEGLRFGGDSKAKMEAAAEEMKNYYLTNGHSLTEILDGPVTDGLVLLNPRGREFKEWKGVLIRFNTSSINGGDSENNSLRWFIGKDAKIGMEVQQEIPNPLQNSGVMPFQSDLKFTENASMIGVSKLTNQLFSHLSKSTSVLLTGGLGSGKTSLACLLGHKLRSTCLFHTTMFSCRKLVTDETRISAIKETFERLLMTASWGARLGGGAVVILDDLDKLCAVETELQVGGNNDRSQQISELLCSMVYQYCGVNSGVVLLVTAQSKESLHGVIIGGHVIREIISLKAPDKDSRRNLLQGLVLGNQNEELISNGVKGTSDIAKASNHENEVAWMVDSVSNSPSECSHELKMFTVAANIDFLDLAGQTDGYMPGDLVLFVSRARSESLIRSITLMPESNSTFEKRIRLGKEDFQRALEGFTPASLRNVALQSSMIRFDSIGGLHETRKILLETLKYPTTYAPIFAQCPLRLRSGLLLYGYPGCGKTLLASAVAGECGLNFISVKGPEMLNKYIGASEKSVRDLFERAEAARPCVLFFDEFDSIAPKRGHDSTGVTDRVVNQLLTQMDGAEGLSGVYVLAATSRPDLIDPALLRPGRLDKSLICDLPNLEDRFDIVQALSKKLHISQDILGASDPHETLREVALRTEGYSGADLQAVIYNAHLEAVHDRLNDKNGIEETRHKSNEDETQPHRSPLQKNETHSFRYGGQQDPISSASPSQMLAKHASIIEKLETIRKIKRKARHSHREDSTSISAGVDGNSFKNEINAKAVIIQWKHLEVSMATTRSSISADERQRLARIYREFIVGRNGEMPTGQGPTEVGGRSSLM